MISGGGEFKVGGYVLWVFFSNVCVDCVGLLAANMAKCQATRPDQHMCSQLAVEWKKSFQSEGCCWSEAEFLFSAGKSLFQACVASTSS